MSDFEAGATRSDVTFTVDGQRYTVEDAHQTPTSILELAGFDPPQYELARVIGKGDLHVFKTSEPIHVNGGEEFVTIRRSAPVQ